MSRDIEVAKVAGFGEATLDSEGNTGCPIGQRPDLVEVPPAVSDLRGTLDVRTSSIMDDLIKKARCWTEEVAIDTLDGASGPEVKHLRGRII